MSIIVLPKENNTNAQYQWCPKCHKIRDNKNKFVAKSKNPSFVVGLDDTTMLVCFICTFGEFKEAERKYNDI